MRLVPLIVPVKVLFFGQLKDITGRPNDTLEVVPGTTLAGIFDLYADRYPKLRELSSSIVLARNQQFSPRAEQVSDGDEIAFLPPASGGTGPYSHVMDEGGHFFALTRESIDVDALKRHVLRGEDGAVIVFEGVVRNNSNGRRTNYLDYECYEPMALKLMARIGAEIAAGRPIARIAIVHRLGRLLIGETSVAVIVTAPHRRPAVEAALEGIDRLKKIVPIWKKEYFADGEVWAEGEWDSRVAR